VMYEIYQGAFGGAADDVDLTTGGLTLIDSGSTPFTSLIGEGSFASFSTSLNLGSANSTDPLWLRLSTLPGAGGDAGSWVAVDDVIVGVLPDYEWNVDASGTWNNPSNWSDGVPPISGSPFPGATGGVPLQTMW